MACASLMSTVSIRLSFAAKLSTRNGNKVSSAGHIRTRSTWLTGLSVVPTTSRSVAALPDACAWPSGIVLPCARNARTSASSTPTSDWSTRRPRSRCPPSGCGSTSLRRRPSRGSHVPPQPGISSGGHLARAGELGIGKTQLAHRALPGWVSFNKLHSDRSSGLV